LSTPTYHDLDDDRSLNVRRLAIIKQQLAAPLTQIFGYHALLYTPLARSLCADSLVIKDQIVISQSCASLSQKRVSPNSISLVCRFEELPVASDCIDLAVLPMILQASENPHQVLREVERTLIPEGVVILIGRNPFSWYGLKNNLLRRRNKPDSPADISHRRAADWFNLLGFEREALIKISVTNQKIQESRSYTWIKKMSEYFCDYFGSYYIIIAKKRVSTLTPIRPSWRKNKQLVAPRLAEPSVKALVERWIEQLK